MAMMMVLTLFPMSAFAGRSGSSDENFPSDYDDTHDMSNVGFNVNISKSETQHFEGSTTSRMIAVSGNGTVANLYFDDCTIDMTDHIKLTLKYDQYYPAIEISSGATVNMYIKGICKFTGGEYAPGIHVAEGAKLNIHVNISSELNAQGGYGAAGIGGCNGDENDCLVYTGANSGEININGGDGTVNAKGGFAGAGIGGGFKSDNGGKSSVINITGNTVNATGGYGAAGIGGGGNGQTLGVTLSGGKITAETSFDEKGNINGGAFKAGGGGKNTVPTIQFEDGGYVLLSCEGAININEKLLHDTASIDAFTGARGSKKITLDFRSDTEPPKIGLEANKTYVLEDGLLKFNVTDSQSGVNFVSYMDSTMSEGVRISPDGDGKYSIPFKSGEIYTVAAVDNYGRFNWIRNFRIVYQFNVRYFANGSLIKEVKVTDGNTVLQSDIPAIPSKQNYTRVQPYWSVDTTSAAAIKNSASGTTVNVNAVYTLDQYNISYFLDGGTNNGSNPNTYTLESSDIILGNPTKENYDFLGWTGSNGTTPRLEVTIPQGSTEDKEFTANWAVKPADYSKVDAAIAEIPKDLTLYTDESVAALTAAKEAVVYGKSILEQNIVNGYAETIEKAIAGLRLKPVPKSKGTANTGDPSNISLLFASLMTSGCMLTTLAVGRKRRRKK